MFYSNVIPQTEISSLISAIKYNILEIQGSFLIFRNEIFVTTAVFIVIEDDTIILLSKTMPEPILNEIEQ